MHHRYMTRSLIVLIILSLTACKAKPQSSAACAYDGTGADYLNRIGCETDFSYIKGKPLTEKFGYAQSIKIVYEISGQKIYFTNSSRFPFHYEFCINALGEEDGLQEFNAKNYRSGHRREYILLNLNYYSSVDVYALELMPEDDTDPAEIFKLYKRIAALTYFPEKIKMLVSSPAMQSKYETVKEFPLITSDEIYKGRNYVALNKGKTFGRLKWVSASNINKTSIEKTDIVILDGLPNQLPVVSGVLTVPFQTPLCHISLLCLNRGTPNASFRNAWSSEALRKFEDQLVCYEVRTDTFVIRTASANEVKDFFAKQQERKPIRLVMDTSTKGLREMDGLSFRDVSLVGGKAANFAELSKIKFAKKALPLPEGAFAIPFFYYQQHIRNHQLGPKIDSLLAGRVLNDPELLKRKLKELRDAIKDAPLSADLLQAVTARMKKNGTEFVNYRFRSSTNAEDVKGFNGAGLYDSKTGSLTDPARSIDKAIKSVWASLWEERAFLEREFFRIDQHSVAMGILVHRSFGEEIANGVAVTKHLYRDNYPAYTINAQVGEISVVTPPDSVSCDELIIGLGEVTGSGDIEVEYIGRSNLSKNKTVLTNDQLSLLAGYLKAIKDHYYYKVEKGSKPSTYWNYGMDVEFKIDAHTGNLYIKQARNL